MCRNLRKTVVHHTVAALREMFHPYAFPGLGKTSLYMELGKSKREACTVTHMVIFVLSLVLLLKKVISMLVIAFLFFCKWNSMRLW